MGPRSASRTLSPRSTISATSTELLDDAGEHSDHLRGACERARAARDPHVGTARVVRRVMSSASASARVAIPVPSSAGAAGAEQGRREVGDELVDQPGAQERARPGAARPRAAPRRGRGVQLVQQRGEVDAAARRRHRPRRRWRSSVGGGRRRAPARRPACGRGCRRPPAAAGRAPGRRRRRARSAPGRRPGPCPTPAMITSHVGAQRVGVGARLGAGDPAAGAVGRGDPAVQGRGDLPHDERTAAPYGGQPALVAGLGLGRQHPGLDVDAGRAQRRGPPPRFRGSGRRRRTRHGRTPASISACAHGPVRPVWLHGSRVTTTVPPRARSPASARARTSACVAAGPLVPALADDGTGRVEDDGADDGVGSGGSPSPRAASRRRGASPRSRSGWPRALPARSRARSGVRRRVADGGRRAPRRTTSVATQPDDTRRAASHPDFHRRSRSSTRSTGHGRCRLSPGRGLSPPVRNCTDPGARI